jgi:hypothetical protein
MLVETLPARLIICTYTTSNEMLFLTRLAQYISRLAQCKRQGSSSLQNEFSTCYLAKTADTEHLVSTASRRHMSMKNASNR